LAAKFGCRLIEGVRFYFLARTLPIVKPRDHHAKHGTVAVGKSRQDSLVALSSAQFQHIISQETAFQSHPLSAYSDDNQVGSVDNY